MQESKLMRSKSQLEMTITQMSKYQKERDYLQAQKAKNQCEKLKKQIVKLENDQRKDLHKKDIQNIKSYHREEIQMLEKHWEKNLIQLQQQKIEMLDRLQKNHHQQRKTIQKELDCQANSYRESAAVINLAQKEKNCAKLKKFQEADQAHEQKEKLIELEKKNWRLLIQQKIKNKLKRLETKQQQEKKVLMRKLEVKMEDSIKRKEKQFDQIGKKHRNVLRNCQGMHQKQNILSCTQLKILTIKSAMTSRQRINSAFRQSLGKKNKRI